MTPSETHPWTLIREPGRPRRPPCRYSCRRSRCAMRPPGNEVGALRTSGGTAPGSRHPMGARPAVPVGSAGIAPQPAHRETPPGPPPVRAAPDFRPRANAPPPRATTRGEGPSSARSSPSASCSARRNSGSPDSRKICSMLRCSRAWIRSSKSSKRQSSCRARARPALLLPAPMNPTRKTARASRAQTNWLPETNPLRFSCLPKCRIVRRNG